MKDLMQGAFSVAVLFFMTEVICVFCPKGQMLRFLRGLMVTAMALPLLLSLGNVEQLDFGQFHEADLGQPALTGYLDDQYQLAVQQDTRAYVEGLLRTIQVEAKEIQVRTDKSTEDRIEIVKIVVIVGYETDRERAEALLLNVLGDAIPLDVILQEGA